MFLRNRLAAWIAKKIKKSVEEQCAALPYILNPEKLNLELMDQDFVQMLNAFGRYLDSPIHVNVGAATGEGHSPNSFHYRRPAAVADFYVPGISLLTLAEALGEFEYKKKKFTGIGLYPYWNNPGAHVDLRRRPVYWYRDEERSYHYDRRYGEIQARVEELYTTRTDMVISKTGEFCTSDY